MLLRTASDSSQPPFEDVKEYSEYESERVWTSTSVKRLIEERLSLETEFREKQKSKRTLWNTIVANIQQYVHKPITITEAQRKFSNLKTTYNRNIIKKNRSGEQSVIWEYFDDFDAVYAGQLHVKSSRGNAASKLKKPVASTSSSLDDDNQMYDAASEDAQNYVDYDMHEFLTTQLACDSQHSLPEFVNQSTLKIINVSELLPNTMESHNNSGVTIKHSESVSTSEYQRGSIARAASSRTYSRHSPLSPSMRNSHRAYSDTSCDESEFRESRTRRRRRNSHRPSLREYLDDDSRMRERELLEIIVRQNDKLLKFEERKVNAIERLYSVMEKSLHELVNSRK